MSNAKDTGGSAFPEVFSDHDQKSNDQWVTETYTSGGMTLRDYFAAKAMAALIIDPARADQSRQECARLSYLMADSMIAARAQ